MRQTARFIPALLVAAFLVPGLLDAQVELGDPTADPSSDELVDKVAAVVGDSIVLYSQVLEQIGRLQAQGMDVPDPGTPEMSQLERQILDQLVDQQILLQAAARDTLVAVSDDEVEQRFQMAWEEQINRFGGTEAQFREAVEQSGENFSQYQTTLREEIRRSLLLQRFMQEQIRTVGQVAVRDQEVREFFERDRARFGERPATLSFRQVFLQPRASDEARTEARERADEILQQLRDGEDFEELAQRYSDDEQTRQEGGDLGWYRRGDGLVEDFEDVAFAMREGQISGVVETPFGAHIIKVDRVRGAERKIRHILISSEITPADETRARERATEIANEVREGAAFRDYDLEAAQFGLPDSITIAQDQLEQFPETFANALRTASEGEVVGPVEFPLGQGLTVFAVARIDRLRDAGEFEFEDVREQLRANLREERTEERVLERLRQRTYVDIRL